MTTFSSVLVPVSRARQTAQAIDLATNLVADDGRVILLHVVEPIQNTHEADFAKLYRALTETAEHDLLSAAGVYRDIGINLETRVTKGKRVQEILRIAERENADLIVLQSHSVDLTDPTKGWNTISYRVGVLARCLVMLVK